jgi:bacteriocin-like protein
MSADLSAKDFESLQDQKELSNEELNEVVGGSGQLTHYEVVESALFKVTSGCEMVRSSERLKICFAMGAERCDYYEWNGKGSNDLKCTCCINLTNWEIQFIKKV